MSGLGEWGQPIRMPHKTSSGGPMAYVVTTVNADGTVDLRNKLSRATRSRVAGMAGWTASVGDVVIAVDLGGNPQTPAIIAVQDATNDPVSALGGRVAALEAWRNGSKGAGRWVAITAGNAAGRGWTWTPTTAFPGDAAFYQMGTPPGGPPYAANSGVKVLQSGVYRINANVLCQAVAASGRYDAALLILDAAGAAAINLDERLANYVSGGSTFVSFEMFGEFPLIAGQWIWPQNVTAQTYGDGSGAFSHLTIRYLGT